MRLSIIMEWQSAMPSLVEIALEMFSGEVVDAESVPFLPPEPELGPAPENPRAERGINSKGKKIDVNTDWNV